MNERIKELIEQTGLIGSSGDVYHTSAAGMEKFVEIIIKDVFKCVQHVSRNPHSDMDYEDYMMILNKISRHFGL